MVKVSVEVRDGAARFDASVHAESIRKALRIAGTRYQGGDVRVRFPIHPEGFFAKATTAAAETAA
jgi:hypothetical protein